MVKVLAPTSGRPGKNSAVSLPLNCTALPTGESTSLGAPSTLGTRPPICDRLLNFHSCSRAQESLAEIADRPKSAATTMLHLLITFPPDFVLFGRDVDASVAALQSP